MSSHGSATPRTTQEILDHAAELAARFEVHDPGDSVKDAEELREVRDAVLARAETEQAVLHAVIAARQAGHSWAAIAAMLGTSGEAARQRYAQLVPSD